MKWNGIESSRSAEPPIEIKGDHQQRNLMGAIRKNHTVRIDLAELDESDRNLVVFFCRRSVAVVGVVEFIGPGSRMMMHSG